MEKVETGFSGFRPCRMGAGVAVQLWRYTRSRHPTFQILGKEHADLVLFANEKGRDVELRQGISERILRTVATAKSAPRLRHVGWSGKSLVDATKQGNSVQCPTNGRREGEIAR
jgi:hypothetical protein